ncbi:MAG: hypothetical protein VW268_04245 [Rhodospirillaceae bacterium]
MTPLGRLGDLPIAMIRDACIREYTFCRDIREPIYSEIIQVLCGFARHYVRLLLPLADGAGRVTRIAYVVRRVTPLTPFDAARMVRPPGLLPPVRNEGDCS